MLMITSFANPRVAQAFVDYMQTQGVILTIQHHEQTDIWLADESQAERVRSELARFLENPADPRYLAASWQSGQTDSGLHYRRFPLSAALRERGGPLTIAISVLCIIVFLLMNVMGDEVVMAWLAWPWMRACALKPGATSPTRSCTFRCCTFSLTSSGGGILAARWRSGSAAANW